MREVYIINKIRIYATSASKNKHRKQVDIMSNTSNTITLSGVKEVTPKVTISQLDYESISDKPLYIHIYDDNYTTIKIEISSNNYIITMYYNGFIYQVYTLDIYELENHKQLNNAINNIIVLNDVYTDDINAYKISRVYF